MTSSSADRAQKREEEHRADADSDLETEVLLKRAEARKSEAERDAAARDLAAQREIEFEAAYLQAIHDHEAAQQIVTAQHDIIAARAQRIRSITSELADIRKVYEKTRAGLDQAREDHKHAVAAVQHFAKPATVFISRRTGMLKIRQGHAEVLATPVKLSFPEARIGTHVFHALGYRDGSQTELKWQSLTLTDTSPELPGRPHRRNAAADQSLPPAPTAANALERIDIPEDIRQRITELMKPGSALIISDDPASNETGAHTDFIVQPRI